MLRILRALLGRELALGGNLLFLDPEPHLEWRDRNRGERDQHPDSRRIIETHQFAPLAYSGMCVLAGPPSMGEATAGLQSALPFERRRPSRFARARAPAVLTPCYSRH